MSNDFRFRELLPGEETKACELVMDCFNEFVAPGYSDQGNQEFMKFANADAMSARLNSEGNFVLLALNDKQLSGVIEIRSNNHVALLFVKKEFHKKGIAKKLLHLAVEKCRQANPQTNIIDVNSSPYAVEIYKSLGFVQTAEEQVIDGIRFVPLTLNLNYYKEKKGIGTGEITEEVEGGFIISNDRTRLNTERICYLLSKTYWADKRSEDKIELSIQNSICYGVYKNDLQIGFARVVTDFATMFWLGDVVIDEEYRDKGLGKKLVDLIVNSEELQGLKGFLSTKNAHGLYEKYGFVRSGDIFMSRN